MFAHLLPPGFQDEVKRWLNDDCPTTDIGGFVVGEKVEVAYLYCKSPGMLAGVPFAEVLFSYLDLTVVWRYPEGTFLDPTAVPGNKIIVAEVSGPCRKILLVERMMLNIISRASGVATAAFVASNIAKERGWKGYVAGTRKTTPGFKNVEKYALLVGGAATHRQDLSQMVMLKDNHVWSCGSIATAVQKARSAAGFSMKIEVECQSVQEALEAAGAGADIVMLDNTQPDDIQAKARMIKQAYPHVLIEASGGIKEADMHLYMVPEIDIVSRGSLTHGYSCVDFSLKIIPSLPTHQPTSTEVTSP